MAKFYFIVYSLDPDLKSFSSTSCDDTVLYAHRAYEVFSVAYPSLQILDFFQNINNKRKQQGYKETECVPSKPFGRQKNQLRISGVFML